MKQTPAHDEFNRQVLELMRPDLSHIVEVGPSTGALAKAYKDINPNCTYIGIEIDPNYAAAAKSYCDEVIVGNIEHFSDDDFALFKDTQCWIFGDVLEHLYDPWSLLKKIRAFIPASSEVIACIPNAQHWSLQAALCTGQLYYQDSGLLDRTHIRFFTRQTMIQLFGQANFQIMNGTARIMAEPPEAIAKAIAALAAATDANPEEAISDATVFQWVLRAIPAE